METAQEKLSELGACLCAPLGLPVYMPTLYLIPTLLADDTAEQVLPPPIRESLKKRRLILLKTSGLHDALSVA